MNERLRSWNHWNMGVDTSVDCVDALAHGGNRHARHKRDKISAATECSLYRWLSTASSG